MYENYYVSQSGSGMPVFEGHRGQRGHGLGSMLAGLFRGALPMLKRGLSIFGKQALRSGLEVANDVAEGRDWRYSLRQHAPVGISRGIKAFSSAWPDISSQSGSGKPKSLFGKRKRKRKGKRKSVTKIKKGATKNKNKKKKKSARHKKIRLGDIFT